MVAGGEEEGGGHEDDCWEECGGHCQVCVCFFLAIVVTFMVSVAELMERGKRTTVGEWISG